MCGIAGIMFKNGRNDHETGVALIDMLDGCQHRGPDSTGFALYGEEQRYELKLRFLVGEGAEANESEALIKTALETHDAEIVEDKRVGNTYQAVVKFDGDL